MFSGITMHCVIPGLHVGVGRGQADVQELSARDESSSLLRVQIPRVRGATGQGRLEAHWGLTAGERQVVQGEKADIIMLVC